MTPLMLAVKRGDSALVTLLVSRAGADLEQTQLMPRRFRALHVAVYFQKPEMVALLLQLGADKTAWALARYPTPCQTPLMMAYDRPNHRVYQLLKQVSSEREVRAVEGLRSASGVQHAKRPDKDALNVTQQDAWEANLNVAVLRDQHKQARVREMHAAHVEQRPPLYTAREAREPPSYGARRAGAAPPPFRDPSRNDYYMSSVERMRREGAFPGALRLGGAEAADAEGADAPPKYDETVSRVIGGFSLPVLVLVQHSVRRVVLPQVHERMLVSELERLARATVGIPAPAGSPPTFRVLRSGRVMRASEKLGKAPEDWSLVFKEMEP